MKLIELLEKYPKAFQYRAERYGFDLFGFECGDGWTRIIEPIAQYLDKANAEEPKIWVAQVKEKFGGLRFYVHGMDDELQNIIRKAEEDSYKTCEVCGEPGETRPQRWIQTLCETHFKKED